MTTSTSRTRPAKPPLSRDVIVATALDLVDESGLTAVSMRKVAARLDTAAASLYVYVDDRKDLLEAAYDLALAEVGTSAVGGAWSEELERLVTDQITVLSTHDDLAVVALTEAQVGPNSLRITERTLSLLRSGGIPDRSCIAAADLLDQYAASAAVERAGWRREARAAAQESSEGTNTEHLIRSAAGRIEAAYATLPAEEFPAITALRNSRPEPDPEVRHRWKLRAIIAGIVAGGALSGDE